MTGIKFILMCHFITCGWVLILYMSVELDQKLDGKGLISNWVDAIYLMCATISTVGYGDISATNTAERIAASIIMIIGVIAFSFSTGSLSSII